MKRALLMRALVVAVFGGLMVAAPRPALALPTFAQAYGVDCSACHTMIPTLNAYGRYVQATSFGALDPDVMKRAVPIVVRESISDRSTGKLNRLNANEKITTGNLSANLVGVLNKYISYRFEQTLYSNDLGGGSTGHFWVSYNQLFSGNGHLKVGKFDTPSAPAFSYWGDISGFSSGSVTVGQHAYNLSGTRWGADFTWADKDYQKMPIRADLAYVGNGPGMYNSSVFNISNPYMTVPSPTAGSDKALIYKAAWARPDNPLEVGLYGSGGDYILKTNYLDPEDHYHSAGLYAERDPVKGLPGIFVFYQTTNDDNVGPGKSAQHLTQAASSWSYAFEVDQPFFNGNLFLGVRPVEYVNGLVASKSGLDYTRTAAPHYGAFDLFFRQPKLSKYLWFQFENAEAAASNAPNGKGTWRAAIRWASPIAGTQF